MVDIFSIEASKLSRGMQLLRDELKTRKWQAHVPYIGSPHVFIRRSDNSEMHIFATTPPTTSFAAAHLANDKFATHQVVERLGIPQPKSVLVDSTEPGKAQALLDKVGKVVVKPLDAGHGKGITINVIDNASLHSAINYAFQYSRSAKMVLVQEQYDHPEIFDIRLSCINYRFVAATLRLPAKVVADGTHTILQLIDLENNSEKRGEPYYYPLAVIDRVAAIEYLGDDATKVYSAGKKVQVLGIANYGAGGEIIDITDDIPDWLAKNAEEISKKIELPVSGVDFLVKSLPKKSATRNVIDPLFIEINKSPSLAIHDLPGIGMSRHTIATYVDYLSQLP
jgi:cyanophycin synthetase